eukprot:9812179-Alexandrium_andersonii.AAC.1
MLVGILPVAGQKRAQRAQGARAWSRLPKQSAEHLTSLRDRAGLAAVQPGAAAREDAAPLALVGLAVCDIPLQCCCGVVDLKNRDA